MYLLLCALCVFAHFFAQFCAKTQRNKERKEIKSIEAQGLPTLHAADDDVRAGGSASSLLFSSLGVSALATWRHGVQ